MGMQADLHPTRIQQPEPYQGKRGQNFLYLLRTTDHKMIGKRYIVTTIGFFMIAGVTAMLIRAELGQPGMQFLSAEQYNQMFTLHGTLMLLLYATPTLFAFA